MDRRPDERGAVAIMVAVMAVVLFVIAALVVDLGLARDTQRRSQNAADASALAAGNVLYQTTAVCTVVPCISSSVAAAKTYALENFDVPLTAWNTCSDPAPLAFRPPTEVGSCISFDQAAQPTRVRVVVPIRSLDTTLGVLASVRRIDVTAAARAALLPGGALPCGLCVLGSGTTHDLQNGDATVTNGNIHFNGNVNVAGNGLVAAGGTITVEGSASGSLANYTPDPTTGVAPITDPLAHLPLPPDMSSLTAKSDPCTQGPGIYTDQDLRNRTCTLTPGLYVVRSGVWDLAGNASTILRGNGVTLYFTCSTGASVRACNAGESGASMDFSGNGSLQIQAPSSGPLAGLAVVYDRNNSSTLRMTGNGSGGMSGAVYGASASLLLNGNGCAIPYSSVVIVKDLAFNGNPACLSVNYDESLNPKAVAAGLHLDQ